MQHITCAAESWLIWLQLAISSRDRRYHKIHLYEGTREGNTKTGFSENEIEAKANSENKIANKNVNF